MTPDEAHELTSVRGHLAPLGRSVAAAHRIGAVNNNNRLFRLDLVDGPSLVAKLYYRDGRRRLEREFDTLTFLAARGFDRVPRPIARDDDEYWAVYTFEPGTVRGPPELTHDDVRALALFAAELQRIPHCEQLEPGGWAGISSADLRARIDGELTRRLALAPPELREPVAAAAAKAVDVALAYRSPPPDRWRLNHCDFAPHNVLFDGSSLSVVDWEAAGWDDPARLILDFVLHEATRGLRPSHVDLFLRTYFAVHPPTEAELARWRDLHRLLQFAWIVGFLNAFDPSHLERKRFANPDLDVDAFQTGQVAKLRARLERVADPPPDPLLAPGA